MKYVYTGSRSRFMPLPVRHWFQGASGLLFTRDGVPSVDGLDAAIRGFGVAIVAILSIIGYGRPEGPYFFDIADPRVVAAALVAYNLVVITMLGVPWRHTPGFQLFLLDWLVASTAIVLTGGFISPFNILYYALVIGAALRIGLSRSLVLVLFCALVYIMLTVVHPETVAAIRLPILIVQIASLAMVMFMSVGMKRAVEAEVQKVELEEQAASQLRLLNNLTNTVLSGSPDLEHVLRTVATVSSEALQADSGLAVLFDLNNDTIDGYIGSVPSEDGFLIVADRDPNPPTLSAQERYVLKHAVESRSPALIQDTEHGELQPNSPLYAGFERPGATVRAIACVPFLLNDRVIGALFVGRYAERPFSVSEVSLLTAISQQMAVAVRLARLYDMEREKAVRSEERERLERDLLSMVSHELRTPLTSIKTCVGALSNAGHKAESDDAVESKLLSNIGRSTDRLITLVNELLDMARLRAGRVSLSLQTLNLGDVVLDTATQVRPLLEARQQELEIDLPVAGSPRWHKLNALADRRRIEQVLLNLVSNANKYGPSGSKIVLGATPRGGVIKVFVRDEGPGIASYEQDHVFEKFYQGASAFPRGGKTESTGLGLAIARSIVELHGGQIGVYSKIGCGSTFYFTLPFEDCEAGEQGIEPDSLQLETQE
ncbi:MAG: ATP-binding protein [Chloroflexota bacterium]